MKKKGPVNKKDKTAKGAVGRTEEDPDDLVHSPDEEIPKDLGEADPDDLVHQPRKKKSGQVDESLADPDDLVHEDEEDEEERE